LEGTLTYQPNRLILEPGQRLVVENFAKKAGTRLALRPARKRLFIKEPDLPSLQVELNKPAFAAMLSTDDPEGRPLLVFETDEVSAGIRDLYRNAEIPFVEAENTLGRSTLRFERPGFTAKLQFDDRGDSAAVEAVLGWAETASPRDKGRLIRSDIERVLTEALSALADELGIATHHHVPFGYAVGYRPDLPRAIARHTIEMAVSLRPEINQSAPIVLPIRIDSENGYRNGDTLDRDQSIADFVCSVGMPMAAVQPGDAGKFRLTYSLADSDDVQIGCEDVEGWRAAIKEIAKHAKEVTQSGTAGNGEAPFSGN
jgi:hypothetical protein